MLAVSARLAWLVWAAWSERRKVRDRMRLRARARKCGGKRNVPAVAMVTRNSPDLKIVGPKAAVAVIATGPRPVASSTATVKVTVRPVAAKAVIAVIAKALRPAASLIAAPKAMA